METTLNIGDYVLASKYSDADPGDPWAVGFLNEIIDGRYFVGNDDIHSFRFSGYRHCVKIPEYIGDWLLKNAEVLESSPPGSINLFKALDTERNQDDE